MKKLLSILFVFAFLLFFASLFSQKIFATTCASLSSITQCKNAMCNNGVGDSEINGSFSDCGNGTGNFWCCASKCTLNPNNCPSGYTCVGDGNVSDSKNNIGKCSQGGGSSVSISTPSDPCSVVSPYTDEVPSGWYCPTDGGSILYNCAGGKTSSQKTCTKGCQETTGEDICVDDSSTTTCTPSRCNQICNGSCDLFAPKCNGSVCCGQPNCAGTPIEHNSAQCKGVIWNGKPLTCGSSNSTPVINGYIDGAYCTPTDPAHIGGTTNTWIPSTVSAIYGWACNTGTDSPLTNVDLYDNGTKFTTVTADKPRNEANFKTNSHCQSINHGYYYAIPADRASGTHTITAKVGSQALIVWARTGYPIQNQYSNCTVASNTTTLTIDVGLDGIGHVGDRVNPAWAPVAGQANTGSNQTPKTNPRKDFDIKVGSVDKSGQIFTYDPAKGIYEGTVDLGTSFATCTSCVVSITTGGHLVRKVTVPTITAGSTTNKITYDSTNGPNMIAGDIAGSATAGMDNGLGPLDYQALLSCMNDADIPSFDSHVTCNSMPAYIKDTDLNDDGNIDKFDYNLFIREISKGHLGD